MGNNNSSSGNGKSVEGEGVTNSQTLVKPQNIEPLAPVKDLTLECSELKEMVNELSAAIDGIFEERSEDDKSVMNMESKLQTMTRNNQLQIQRLHRQLERHSKLINAETNVQLKTLVKELVSIVNDYMNMLLRNIRKVRRSYEEMDLADDNSLSTGMALHKNPMPEQIDVIPEHLDINSMLIELTKTEVTREQLEKDIVDVLVIWRDYKDILGLQANMENAIEQEIRDAGLSIVSNVHGVVGKKKS